MRARSSSILALKVSSATGLNDSAVAEAIVIQTCLAGYLPIIAGSDDFPGKDSFLLVSGKILPALMKQIDTELDVIDKEVSAETTPTLVYSKEQT